MSSKRYYHSKCVAEMSKIIATKVGIDTEKAYFSGLVHDIAREFSKEKQLQYKSNINNISDSFLDKDILLHGPIGAIFLSDRFNITDQDILEAVKYHSVGNRELSNNAKVVYVADYISLDRKHITSDYRKSIINLSINDMVTNVAESCVNYLIKSGKTLAEETINMINELKGTNNEG